MQTKCFFRASSGTDWELTIEHEESQYCPTMIAEGPDGGIYELDGEKCWNDLSHMTQTLRVEIIESATDVGD